MIANFTNFLSNMDKNSQFLLIIIFIIVFLLFLIFIINSINAKRARRINAKKSAYRRKLIEEIDNEAKNIVPNNIKVEHKKAMTKVEEEIEVLDSENDEIDDIIDDLRVNNNVSTIDLTDFEREQEESAIISYEELCKKHGVPQKLYNKEETTVIEKVNNIVENKTSVFKPTQYVSPIFGLQQEEAKDQAFLTNLKEFRSGLE
ncbi:MAG: hypothetical protein IKE73_00580 [Bacilli bacterium]|nr:hypothetical protein [Bacilli bacterium]